MKTIEETAVIQYETQQRYIHVCDDIMQDFVDGLTDEILASGVNWVFETEDYLAKFDLDQHEEFTFSSWVAKTMTSDIREKLSIEVWNLLAGQCDRDDASTLSDFYLKFLESQGFDEQILKKVKVSDFV